MDYTLAVLTPIVVSQEQAEVNNHFLIKIGLAIGAAGFRRVPLVFKLLKLRAAMAPHTMEATASAMTAATQPKQLWTCGMHPQVIQDHPGTCPICHMKLTPLKSDSDDEAGNAANGKRKILYYWDPMLGPSSIARSRQEPRMGMDLVPVYEDEQSAGPTVKD